MLDQSTIEGNLLSILIYLVLFVYSVYVLLTYKSTSRVTVSVFQHLLVIFFCVFAFWDSDYYHYKEILSYINPEHGYTNQATHLEPLYIWLYDISGRSYLIFRLYVWGVSYLLFIYLSKKIDAYNRLTFSLFTILYCVTFSYARVSLGMVTLYLGIILLLYNDKRFINAIIGVLVLILCYFSHKTMFVPLCLVPLYFVRYRRSYMIMIILIVFLIALFYSQNIISVLVDGPDSVGQFEMLSDTFKSASTYGEQGVSLQSGMGAILLRIIQYASLIIPLIYMSNRKIYRFIQDNIRYRVLYNGALIIVSFALSLGAIISFNSPLCYRYLYMSYVPVVLLLSVLYGQNLLTRKKITIIIVVAGISVWYRLLYSFYLTTLIDNY